MWHCGSTLGPFQHPGVTTLTKCSTCTESCQRRCVSGTNLTYGKVHDLTISKTMLLPISPGPSMRRSNRAVMCLHIPALEHCIWGRHMSHVCVCVLCPAARAYVCVRVCVCHCPCCRLAVDARGEADLRPAASSVLTLTASHVGVQTADLACAVIEQALPSRQFVIDSQPGHEKVILEW